jgi:hypothetical protein
MCEHDHRQGRGGKNAFSDAGRQATSPAKQTLAHAKASQ